MKFSTLNRGVYITKCPKIINRNRKNPSDDRMKKIILISILRNIKCYIEIGTQGKIPHETDI